jgi:hypothetical protein
MPRRISFFDLALWMIGSTLREVVMEVMKSLARGSREFPQNSENFFWPRAQGISKRTNRVLPGAKKPCGGQPRAGTEAAQLKKLGLRVNT